MMTFHHELNCRPNKQGRYVIFLRITDTETKKLKRIKSTIDLASPSDWNKRKQVVRTSERNAELWNSVLEAELENAKQTYRTLAADGQATAGQIAERIKSTGRSTTLVAYAKQMLEAMEAEGRFGSRKKYADSVKNLESFLTDSRGTLKDVPFSQVTPAFVEDYIAYLRKLPNKKKPAKDGQPAVGLHPNTIAKHLKVFRAVVNRAMNIDGLLKPENNPFRQIQIRESKSVKAKLTAEEIKALEDVELPEGSKAWNARNAFLFSYYCAGIRVADVIQLRWNNITEEGRLAYRMAKNGKLKDIVLVPQAKAILAKYAADAKPESFIFPYLDGRADYARYATDEERKLMPLAVKEHLFHSVNSKEVCLNKQLRSAAKAAGIEKHLSFHISRHTFAKQAKIAGTDNELLKDLMAHSSLATTERYMKDFDTSREDKALEEIFEAGKSQPNTEAELLAALRNLNKEQLAALLQKLD